MEIKDVIHLYLGQYAMHGDKRIHVCGVNVNSDKIQNIIGEEYILKSEIKLMLRPLSSITKEETNEAIRIGNEKLDAWIGGAERTKYLLSKGFDLFNLIPEGLALDATKDTNL